MFIKRKSRSAARKKSLSSIFLPFLFILTFILILFNKTDYFLIAKAKNIGVDFAGPLTNFVSSPIKIITNIGENIKSFNGLTIENLKLKEEILRLKKWQILAIKNSRENKVFKKLLNSTSDQVDIIKTASVINQSPGIFNRLITINAGYNHNVKKNYAVINEKGLVGKTIYLTDKNAKVLLISDPASSIPVKTLSGNLLSIISGDINGKYLISSFTKNNKLPRIGDLLVTSGNAKIFPRDILVAKVIDVKDDYYIALPYVDFNNLSYVQVITSK